MNFSEIKARIYKILPVFLVLTTILFFLPNKTYATSGNIYTVDSDTGKLATWLVGPRQMARDSAGNIYAIYNSLGSGPKSNIYLAKSTNQGQTWTKEAVTTGDNYSQMNPSIAIDSQNNLHVVWQGTTTAEEETNYRFQIRYREYTNGAWQNIVELTNQADRGQALPAIAVDSQDNIHLVWYGAATVEEETNYKYQLRYQKYSNGAWQSIEELTTNASYMQAAASIAIDSHDNVHITWEGLTADSPNAYQIRYINYSSGTWQGIVELTTAGDDYAQETPVIAIDSQDNLHVVWMGAVAQAQWLYQIRYREYTNGAWQNIVELTTDFDYFQNDPSIAIDSHDNLHVVFGGMRAGAPAVG